jgi:hypothetical protein
MDHRYKRRLSKQRGAALVVIAASLVVLVGVTGLAIDLGHAYLNLSRLQSAVDATALSAAKTLNDTQDTVRAQDDGQDTFQNFLVGEMGSAGLNPVYQFSDNYFPFVPGGANPSYVRVRVSNFSMPVWLARVLPGVGNTQTVGTSAVAGPSPPLGTGPNGQACDLAPMVVCGTPGVGCSDENCYGYDMGVEVEHELKTHTGSSNDWEVGTGNFQLVQLGCGPGANCLRDALAGGATQCAINKKTVTTKPGNNVGPVAQGFNTRFGMYQGAGMNRSDYPPDTVTYNEPDNEPGFWHSEYESRLSKGPLDNPSIADNGIGVPERRIMAVPFANCTGTANGQGEVVILGFGCFFMTRPASHQGNTQSLYGQFIEECAASGQIAENPGGPAGGPILYKIILYKDPLNQAS